MSVNTYLYYIAIIAVSVWCPIASCSNGNGLAPNEAADSVYALALKKSHEGVRTLRANLLSDYDDGFRSDVYGLFNDSSLRIRAVALYATHDVDEIADSIFADHAVELSHTMFHYLAEGGDTTTASELEAAIVQRFNAMDLDEKAHWIVATLQPSEIPQYLEGGDRALIQHIMPLLNQSDKARFVASLNAQKH